MGKHRIPYPEEFRAHMIELVRAGRRPEDLEKEFEPSAQTIYNCVAQADRDAGVRHDGLTTAERQGATTMATCVLPHEGMLPDGLLSFRFPSSLLLWFAGRGAPGPRRLSNFSATHTSAGATADFRRPP
ncbi:hypothetical protein ACFQVB_41535 [Paraburkholderia humisilvae]|uniref:hypothetical protein n=1 Tax=Paraburkholderia humisilvae TaxID=627669 RepID=UPI0036243D6F